MKNKNKKKYKNPEKYIIRLKKQLENKKRLITSLQSKVHELPETDNMTVNLEFDKNKSTFKIITNGIHNVESDIKSVEANAVINVKTEYLDSGYKEVKIKGKAIKVDINAPLSREDIYSLGENLCSTKKK